MQIYVKLVGYTLLEILLALSIISICAVMTEPCFRAGYYHIKTLCVTQQIINEIYLARSLAITQQQQMSYCTENSIESWNSIRIIKDETGRCRHSFQPLPHHYHLFLRNSLGKNSALTYTPLGFTISERCSFYLKGPDDSIRIIIIQSGKLRVEKIKDKTSN